MTASIHRRVLLWAMGALLVGATLLVGGSWWVLMNEMGEVFEDNLKQVALAVANYHRTDGVARPPRLAQPLPRVYEESGQFEFVTVVWSRDGQRMHSSNAGVALPFLSRSGLSQVTVGGEHWHMYTIVLDDAIVQAAQRAAERESLARETASTLALPALLFLAVIASLLRYALRRGLTPLSKAASEVTGRSVEVLHPISLADHPAELHLLIGAINDLMARLGSALAMQRHFLADAAHELRTPITALRLQLQLLERAGDASQRKAAQAELRAGIDRAQHLVEQLLQLSRLGPEAPALQRESVDLAELARSTVSRFSPRADDLGIDLGAATDGPVVVSGDAQQLSALLDNLVENALRYTPRGGKVDVSALWRDGRPCLSVCDTGPGIAPAERQRVFDRFYRSPQAATANGSGLGLAIVKAVAQRHGAEITLDEAPGGGLAVTVRFTR